MEQKYTHACIVCIVNAGFSDTVMEAAKAFGAKGGTIVHARGSASRDAEKFFQLAIQPEKEMVMILVPEQIKDDILHAIYRAAGLNTQGQGIAFSLSVDNVVGLVKETAPAASAPETDKEKPQQ